MSNLTFAVIDPSVMTMRLIPSMTIEASSCWRDFAIAEPRSADQCQFLRLVVEVGRGLAGQAQRVVDFLEPRFGIVADRYELRLAFFGGFDAEQVETVGQIVAALTEPGRAAPYRRR